jgi:hypothetical protein
VAVVSCITLAVVQRQPVVVVLVVVMVERLQVLLMQRLAYPMDLVVVAAVIVAHQTHARAQQAKPDWLS